LTNLSSGLLDFDPVWYRVWSHYTRCTTKRFTEGHRSQHNVTTAKITLKSGTIDDVTLDVLQMLRSFYRQIIVLL